MKHLYRDFLKIEMIAPAPERIRRGYFSARRKAACSNALKFITM